MNARNDTVSPNPLVTPVTAQRLGPTAPILLGFGVLLALAVQGLSLAMLARPAVPQSLLASEAPTALMPEADYLAAIEAPLQHAPVKLPKLIDIAGLAIPGYPNAQEEPRTVVPLRLPTDAPTPAVDVATSAPVTAPDQVPTATPSSWFDDANPRQYTLQLVSARSEGAVTDFYAAADSSETRALLHLNIKDADWYAVVTGTFANLDRAVAAADAYKARTGSAAWVRRISAVKSERVATLAQAAPAVTAAVAAH